MKLSNFIQLVIVLFIVGLFSISSFADVNVGGYSRKDGTYVQPHNRSDPNSTQNDNWSTKGNTNPHTGREGTINPDNNNW